MTDYWHTTLHQARAKPDPVALAITGIVVVFIVGVFAFAWFSRHSL